MFTKKKIFDQLTAAALKQPDEIILVSPFLSLGTLKDILDKAPNSKITLVTKDDAFDCASGYNDVNAWKEVWRLGGQVYFCEKLHAKYYRFDNDVFVGSANLTDAGVGTSATPNFEILTPVNYDDEVKAVEKDLFSQSVCVEPHDPLVAKFEDVVNQLKVEVKKVRDVKTDALKEVKTFHFASLVKPKTTPVVAKSTSVKIQDFNNESKFMSLETVTNYESCSAVKEIMHEVLTNGHSLVQDSKKVTTFKTPNGIHFGLVWVSSGLKRDSDESKCHDLPYALAFYPDVLSLEDLAKFDAELKGKEYKNSNLKGFPKPEGGQTAYGVLVQVKGKGKLMEILEKYNNLK